MHLDLAVKVYTCHNSAPKAGVMYVWPVYVCVCMTCVCMTDDLYVWTVYMCMYDVCVRVVRVFMYGLCLYNKYMYGLDVLSCVYVWHTYVCV